MTYSNLTVVEQVYYQQLGVAPTVQEARYSFRLDTDEQPFIRRTKVGADWDMLSLGWLKDAALLVISNEEGKQQFFNPTPEESVELSWKVLEISFDGELPALYVRPGRSLTIEPANANLIWIRAKVETKYQLSAYPR